MMQMRMKSAVLLLTFFVLLGLSGDIYCSGSSSIAKGHLTYNVEVVGLEVNGSLLIENQERILVKNSSFTDATGIAVRQVEIRNSSDIEISHNSFSGMDPVQGSEYVAIYIEDSRDIIIEYNSFSDHSSDVSYRMIVLNRVENVTISGNVFGYQSDQYNGVVAIDSTDLELKGNRYSGGVNGSITSFYGCENVTMLETRFETRANATGAINVLKSRNVKIEGLDGPIDLTVDSSHFIEVSGYRDPYATRSQLEVIRSGSFDLATGGGVVVNIVSSDTGQIVLEDGAHVSQVHVISSTNVKVSNGTELGVMTNYVNGTPVDQATQIRTGDQVTVRFDWIYDYSLLAELVNRRTGYIEESFNRTGYLSFKVGGYLDSGEYILRIHVTDENTNRFVQVFEIVYTNELGSELPSETLVEGPSEVISGAVVLIALVVIYGSVRKYLRRGS